MSDLVYRRAVIDAVNAYLMLSQISRTMQDSISLQEIIEHVPAVQPKRKTGKWIFLDECSNSGYYCSECNKKVVKEGWSNTVKKINFCPNCGAKMENADAVSRKYKEVMK